MVGMPNTGREHTGGPKHTHPTRRGGVALTAVIGAVTALACSEPSALAELRSRAAAFDASSLEPQSCGAWRRLSTTSWFGGVTSVMTWGPQAPASDTLTLWHAGEVDALVHLSLKAEPGGRLWAMRGLRYLDRGAFDELACEFRDDPTVVKTVHGCLAGRSSISRLFRDEVVHEEQLKREYDDRFTETMDLLSVLKWSRHARDVGHWRLDTDTAETAAVRLEAATYVGDLNCALARDLDVLLGAESLPYTAAAMLAVSPRPETRYWGAWALRRVAPPAFAALAPFWEEDDTRLTCRTAGGSEEHTLAEAIALHID